MENEFTVKSNLLENCKKHLQIEIFNELFFRTLWEKQPKLFNCSQTLKNEIKKLIKYDSLFNLFINNESKLQYFKSGEKQHPQNVALAYLSHCSVIFNRFDVHHSNIYEICRCLADEWFHHAFAVAYLTPPNSVAVRPHSDDQDVFLFQIWGSKQWKVYPSIVELPYSEEMVGKEEAIHQNLGEPIIEDVLSAGDILYIPRGNVHAASTSNECSLHITITIPTADFCWGIGIERAIHKAVMSNVLSNEAAHFSRSSIMKPREEKLLRNDGTERLVKLAVQEIQESLTMDNIRSAFLERMDSVNISQEEAYKKYQQQLSSTDVSIQMKRRISLVNGITCWCSNDKTNVIFKRGNSSLEMKTEMTSYPLFKILSEEEDPIFIEDIPCDDVFEKICICFVLLYKKLIEYRE